MKTFIYIVLITAFPVILQGQYNWDRHSISATGGEQNTSTYTGISSIQHYEAKVISNSSYTGNTGFLFPEIILLDLRLDVSLFLEGPFNGTNMNTDLYIQNHIPLSQPYNSTPWNYAGSENVANIPNNQVVDWILVELRDAPDASSATPATTIAQQASFLLNDGSVVDIDGSSNLSIEYLVNQSLFVVVWHRNHIGIMSAFPLTLINGKYSYDFSTAESQVHGGISGHAHLGGGVYGMGAGDGNADGNIDALDKSQWEVQVGNPGYLQEDHSMDGQVNNSDKNEKWLNNVSISSQIPD